MGDDGIHETLLFPEPESNLKEWISQESKKIWRVALPSVISRVSSFGTLIVTLSFIGHISSTDLAAYALVQSLTVRFVIGVVVIELLYLLLTSSIYTVCSNFIHKDTNF